MDTDFMNYITAKIKEVQSRRFCPKCGGEMGEVERCNEAGVLFVWHECRKDGCDGQWLQKTSSLPSSSQHGAVGVFRQ